MLSERASGKVDRIPNGVAESRVLGRHHTAPRFHQSLVPSSVRARMFLAQSPPWSSQALLSASNVNRSSLSAVALHDTIDLDPRFVTSAIRDIAPRSTSRSNKALQLAALSHGSSHNPIVADSRRWACFHAHYSEIGAISCTHPRTLNDSIPSAENPTRNE